MLAKYDRGRRRYAPRSRPLLAIAVVTVICLGLASRHYPALLPTALGKYPGDALWALMVLLGLACVWPKAPAPRLAALALLFSCLIELSQLYHVPWLDAVRRTTLGHLVLGSAFSWWDMLAYAVGIGAGLLADVFLAKGKAITG